MSTKIGTITFQASHNCGSLLQAYALQQTLKAMGYDNEIINFSNEGSRDMYSILPPIHLFRRGIRGRLQNWIRSVRYYGILKRQHAFYESFITNKFRISNRVYNSNEELQNAHFDYTHYITGSDQVWNIACPDADTAYYLDFVKKGKKIAYAVSTGATDIAQKANNYGLYKKLVDDFDFISVREQNAVTQFRKMTGRNDIELLIDPTLLFTQGDWENHFNLNRPMVKGDYIFYYAFHYDDAVNKVVMEIAKRMNMPVYIMEAKAWGPKGCNKSGLKLCENSGPEAFLNLMKFAKLSLTTSFHGTVFSVIFRKCFWFIDSAMHNPMDDRAATLVNQLGLPERLIQGEALLQQKVDIMPDYSQMDEHISALQVAAKAFLIRSLS